jgi:hypothetical protein
MLKSPYGKNRRNNMPPFAERIRSYNLEYKKWVQSGKPTRSVNEIIRIYDEYCSKCNKLIHTMGITRCDVCGCLVNKSSTLNKILWSTTRCPLENPKWIEEDYLEQKKEHTKSVEVVTKEIKKEPQEISNKPAAVVPQRCCH